ncbi:hypothetical protein KS4_27180 [Poriferisphaera corsica]|uniref:PepSY domain-containing protein n=1 Tax=Poriferisphaera corsica TaxID=2528020 RepID=A0A517YWR6_9BACT|nr:PepSY-associated TM helix domain-containing protein [Poriferisphaera corsica]QDU34647.1 hypothetical protein KS4_27180 [Poriferisphaera corsica]
MKPKRSIKRFLRSSVYYIHLLLGLSVGLYLLVMGLTGSILVFHEQINETLTPQFHELDLTPQQLSQIDNTQGIERVHQIGTDLYPDRDIARIYLSKDAHVYVMYINRPDNTDNLGWGDQIREVAVHPITYQVLGDRPYYGTFFNFIYAVHMHWLAKIPGWFFNGFASIFAILLLASGLWLWWPGLKPKLFKQRFKINLQSIRRLAWDIHGLLGATSLIFLIVTTITGSYIIFKPIVDAIIPQPQTVAAEVDLNAPIQPLGQMLTTAQQQRDDIEIYGALFLKAPVDKPQRVNFVGRPTDESVPGRYTITLARQGGVIMRISDRTGSNQPLGSVLMDWSTWLHFGTWAGPFSQAFYVLLGFVPSVLFISGLYLYLKKRQSRRKFKLARKQQEASLESAAS